MNQKYQILIVKFKRFEILFYNIVQCVKNNGKNIFQIHVPEFHWCFLSHKKVKYQVLYAVKKVNTIQDHSVNVFEIFCSFN